MRRDLLPVVLCLVAMAVAGCGRKQVVEETKVKWITLKHTPVEEGKTGEETLIQAEASSVGGGDLAVFIYYRVPPDSYQIVEMSLLEPGKYFGFIASHGRGTVVEYYLEARAAADLVARAPSAAAGSAFRLQYKGTPNRQVLIAHVVLIFIALFMFLFSGYVSYRALGDRKFLLHIPRLAFLGVLVFLVASVPLGMLVAYQTYGKPWTGFPVGTDLTDNKSLAILLYWAATAFLYRGSVLRKDPSRDLLSISTMPYVHMAGAVLTVVLFLIPH